MARAEPPPETSPLDAAPPAVSAETPVEETAATAAPATDDEAAELIPTGNLLSVVSEGGVLMLPLLGCSFVLAAFGIV